MASEAETASPTATDADLARVLTRQDEPDDRSDEIQALREENARLRKWDELTREIDREERSEQDSKHYAQALVQHARQQRAARELVMMKPLISPRTRRQRFEGMMNAAVIHPDCRRKP